MALDNNDYDVNLDNYPIVENEEDIDDPFASGIPDPDKPVVADITPDNYLDEKPNEEENDIITTLLSQKGITDYTKIQFQNEEGELEEVNFNDLTKEEQLVILASEPTTPEISEYEMDVVNFMRENNVTLDEVLQYEREKAVAEYVENNKQTDYTVDDLSNEELYRFDLQSRYPNLSDEELDVKIAQELLQPDLFAKMSDALRTEYKGLEDAQQTELAEQKTQEDEKTYNDLVETMVKVAEDTNDLYSLDLEDNDKEEVLSFLLDRDINGQSAFAKLLNDPEELFKLAWFAIKGAEAFDVTHEYYKKEIDTVRKQGSIQPQRTVIKKSEASTEDTYGIWDKK